MNYEKLLVFDGNYLLHRAHHGYQQRLTNSRGEDVTLVYGVLMSIGVSMALFQPNHACFVFDGPNSKDSRTCIYPEYKEGRDGLAESVPTEDGSEIQIHQQLDWLNELIPMLGLHLIVEDGVEADDVVGTLVNRFYPQAKIVVESRDKDLMQFVRRGVRVYDGRTKTMFDVEGVVARYNVQPEHMLEFLCLTGDDIDNVPGCPDVGPVKAAYILNTWGSVDNFVRHMIVAGKRGDDLPKKDVTLYRKVDAWIDAGGYKLAKDLITLQHVDLANSTGKKLQLADLVIRKPQAEIRDKLAGIGIRKLHPWIVQHLSALKTSSMFTNRKRRL